MKTKLSVSLLLVVSSFLQMGCGGLGYADCANSHMVATDQGVSFDMDLEGHASASASESVCYLEGTHLTITTPADKVYEINNSYSRVFSAIDSADIIALFPEFDSIVATSPIVEIILSDDSYSVSDGVPVNSFVTIEVYDGDTSGEPIKSKLITLHKD